MIFRFASSWNNICRIKLAHKSHTVHTVRRVSFQPVARISPLGVFVASITQTGLTSGSCVQPDGRLEEVSHIRRLAFSSRRQLRTAPGLYQSGSNKISHNQE